MRMETSRNGLFRSTVTTSMLGVTYFLAIIVFKSFIYFASFSGDKKELLTFSFPVPPLQLKKRNEKKELDFVELLTVNNIELTLF